MLWALSLRWLLGLGTHRPQPAQDWWGWGLWFEGQGLGCDIWGSIWGQGLGFGLRLRSWGLQPRSRVRICVQGLRLGSGFGVQAKI